MFIHIETGVVTLLYSILCFSQCTCVCCVSFKLIYLSSLGRFLADLMDGPELIRNVTLCGHLHHGKVRASFTAASGSVSLLAAVTHEDLMYMFIPFRPVLWTAWLNKHIQKSGREMMWMWVLTVLISTSLAFITLPHMTAETNMIFYFFQLRYTDILFTEQEVSALVELWHNEDTQLQIDSKFCNDRNMFPSCIGEILSCAFS